MRKQPGCSQRGMDWLEFSRKALMHVETYTVPQYGDKGTDQVTDYSVEDCLKQARKYLERQGRNVRPGQDDLDLLKIAHYIQLAWTKRKEDAK